MRKFQRTICMILCMLLCITGCRSGQNTDKTAGGETPAVSADVEQAVGGDQSGAPSGAEQAASGDQSGASDAQQPTGGQESAASSDAQQPAGGQESAASVQMLDYNKDLTKSARDDNYRTTYEIFVYSFCDSNGDGIGDLNGIRSKLDYIQDLGFDAIWLTPVHPSSTYHKYDVDDYYAIDPAFGTMEDYEALLDECHERGIRVYMDLVLNHTSDDNAWFKAAVDYLHELPSGWEPDTSYCKYYDYYNFTREPANGYAPVEGTEWYYEARFWSEMPDLNLSSEAVRGEICSILEYWLGKGVDGFRLDAVTYYFEGNPDANVEFLRFLTETGQNIDPDCYFVGEAWTDRNAIAQLYGSGIDSLFDFPFSGNEGFIANIVRGNYEASDYVKGMLLAQEAYSAANPNYIDAPFYTNHDMARSAGYYGADEGPVTKMAYALSLFMSGNSFVYYGEEIGMKGAGKDENKRVSMYWSSDPNAPGMCAGPPDMDEMPMKFAPVEEQMKDDLSLYTWFKEVIRVRNAFPAIARGRTEGVDSISDDNVAAFFRRSAEGASDGAAAGAAEDSMDSALDGSSVGGADGDLLIVMNLRAASAEKELAGIGDNLTLAAVLNTNEESITYENGLLTLPGYSIAVFTQN